jgi:phosphotransferase system enzyme I (PtsI)
LADNSPKQQIGNDVGERRFPATALARGVGIGVVEFADTSTAAYEKRSLQASQVDDEIDRIVIAANSVRSTLSDLTNPVEPTNHHISGIFDTHILILESLVDKIKMAIRYDSINAEWATLRLANSYGEVTNGSDKHVDIMDVLQRILTHLSPYEFQGGKHKLGNVIVASVLRPSDVIEFAKRKPAGFIVEHGGWTSHSAILAREMGIPMVSGVSLASENISSDCRVLVDGNLGEVVMNVPASLGDRRMLPFSSINSSVPDSNGTETLDGVEISVRVNLESISSYQIALDAGASGIGLYRSESLIPRSGIAPSEDVQTQAYGEAAAAVKDAGVNIRTFDIASDAIPGESDRHQANPSLGLRSIRLCLSDKARFRSQLRAILRANRDGNVRIVLPFVSGLEEVLRSKDILAEEIRRLDEQGLTVRAPSVGAMIEVPSAVLMAAEIAEHVDFLCLGTNDLVQYLLAVDRDNELVSEWYQTLHPAVIRAIKTVVAAANNASKPLTVCGEMAGSPFYVPLLVGLGVRELSMSVNSIVPVRKLIAGVRHADAAELAAKVEASTTADKAEAVLRLHYLEHWSDLFPAGILDSPLL